MYVLKYIILQSVGVVFFCRKVRTLYSCDAENESELSFEPNQIITNGNIHIVIHQSNRLNIGFQHTLICDWTRFTPLFYMLV